MKVGIVGHGPTLSAATQAVITALEEKGIEVIHISSEEAHDRGIQMNNVFMDDFKSTPIYRAPRMLGLPFQPPLTRRERRKLNRKKK